MSQRKVRGWWKCWHSFSTSFFPAGARPMLSNKCLCMMLVSELHGIIGSSLTQQTHKNTLSITTVLAVSPLLFEMILFSNRICETRKLTDEIRFLLKVQTVIYNLG